MLKSFTGSQDYVNTTTLFSPPPEESCHVIASPTQQRTLNLEFRKQGAGGQRMGEKPHFKSLVCIYNVVEKLHFRME